MIKYIEVDSDNLIICPELHDGRIQKVFLKKTNQVLLVCEECEWAWFSLEELFFEKSCIDFVTYLEDEGHITTEGFDDWDSILENGDFVTFDEVKDVVEKYGIEVVVLE